jgi:hypothetical protein
MSKRQIIPGLTLALAAVTFSACGSSSDTASVSSVSKCAHARPQTISADTPTERMIVQKTSPGGSLFQSAADETEAETQASAPGFDVYVFPDSKTAKEAFALFAHAQNASQEFGGGGTFMAKNIVVSTDQSPPGSLATFADALLKKCAGTTSSQSVYRSEESSTESAATEVPASPESGEVGAPSEAGPSAGQSPYPEERR